MPKGISLPLISISLILVDSQVLPFCDNYVCSPIGLETDFKSNFYEMLSANSLEALIPRRSEPNPKCADILQKPKYVLSDSVPEAALISHGWCRDGRPFDSILSSASHFNNKDMEAEGKMELLLENSTFWNAGFAYTEPKSGGDFGLNGCVDSEGFVMKRYPSRSAGCFSLLIMIAPNALGDEGEMVQKFYSGRLILNAIPMDYGLPDFLANYVPIGERDVLSDIICPEVIPEMAISKTPNGYCVRETRPGVHFRLCCCYAPKDEESTRCHVHTNPLNMPRMGFGSQTEPKPKMLADTPAPTIFRCIYAEFSSVERSIKMDTDSAVLDSFSAFRGFCSIRYSVMLTEGKETVYNFTQGSDPPPKSIEAFFDTAQTDIPHIEELRCFPIKDEHCPQVAEERNETFLQIYCQCKGQYCNVDQKSALIIRRLQEWNERRCEGRGSVMRNIAKDEESCLYFVDPNSGKIYDLDVAVEAKESPVEFASKQLSETVTRFSYEIGPGCMDNPDIPIRAFDAIECEMEPIAQRQCVKTAQYQKPVCELKYITGLGLQSSIRFLMSNIETETNATDRCYASFDMLARDNVTMQAGPVDELSVEDQLECIKKTAEDEIGACAFFQTQDNRTAYCCYSAVTDDPRPDLRNALQTLLLPRQEDEIKQIVDQQQQRKNCFAIPSNRRPVNGEEPENIVKCQNLQYLADDINAKYSGNLENIRFNFCRQNYDRNPCYQGTFRRRYREFCCCHGGSSCQMKIQWGRNIGSFISNNTEHA